MFRSALAAALRHLSRGKLYAAIAVFGLAMGLCAVLLAAPEVSAETEASIFDRSSTAAAPPRVACA